MSLTQTDFENMTKFRWALVDLTAITCTNRNAMRTRYKFSNHWIDYSLFIVVKNWKIKIELKRDEICFEEHSINL